MEDEEDYFPSIPQKERTCCFPLFLDVFILKHTVTSCYLVKFYL